MKNTILPAGVIASVLALSLTQQAQANNLLGVDVSSYQGSPTWSTVKANGAVFAFAKATEGNYDDDADFKSNMTNGKAAGLQMGAYDFARPDTDCVSVDSNYFWSFAGAYFIDDSKTISPVLDYEVAGCDCQSNDTAWANTWGSYVKGKTSVTLHPVLYCSASFACNFIQYNLSGGIALPGWIANYNGGNLYTGNPWETEDCCNCWVTNCSAGSWVLWQVCSTGTIGGISGECDFDAYNGTLATLKSSLGDNGK